MRVALLGAMAAALASPAGADLISVNGKVYENVYVQAGRSMYYILDPIDGSTTGVRKEDVAPHQLTITTSRAEREAIHKAWREKREENEARRGEKTAETLNITSGAKRVATTRSGFSVYRDKNGAPIVTNQPRRLQALAREGRMFVDGDGTRLLTNLPHLFEGHPEYLAVPLDFEIIDVPERFKGLSDDPDFGLASLSEIVSYYARKYKLRESLVYAIIKAESDGNPKAVSSAGALGLMQLMPGTASDMGVTDPFDPAQNIAGGTQYLAKLLDLFNNDLELALAGYNAGPGNVKKYGGIPPFRETQNYVVRVQLLERQYRRIELPF